MTERSLGNIANTIDDVVVRYFDNNTLPVTLSETRGATGFGFDNGIWAAADLVNSSVATELEFDATSGQFESLTLPAFSAAAEPASPADDIIYGFSSQAATVLNPMELEVEAFVEGTWQPAGTVSPGNTFYFG